MIRIKMHMPKVKLSVYPPCKVKYGLQNRVSTVRKVLRSLPERFHAKITAIEESKDIDKIPLIELVGNLQTYVLGLTRIGKLSKSKSMALKAKSNDIDE